MTTTPPDAPLPAPFAVAVDSREQRPYAFAGILSDARTGRRPLAVATARVGLPSGDYGVVGMEGGVAVERKSLADLFSTLAHGRRRFERELARLDALPFAAVVVEAEWSAVLDPAQHGVRSRLDPKAVYRSVIAWQQRYTRCHWWMCIDRRHAEVTTYRILERAWRESRKAEAVKIAAAEVMAS